MTVVNNASVIFKDKNGNVGKVKAPSSNDITKISNAISDVAQVVDPTSHLPINATTSSVGVVQLADSAAIAAGTSGRVVDATQLKDAIEHVTPAGNVMTTDTVQTVTAVKTFSSLPESSVAPTTDNQLVNKKYVDDHVPSISNMVTTDTAQSIIAKKTFTVLPESSVVPTTNNQLVNKKYVDDHTPTGFIGLWDDTNIPKGWLLCNGAAVSRSTYAALFAKLGTRHGAGDGSTTFNLPDMRDRYPIGVGTNALGTQVSEQLPNITGTLDDFSAGINAAAGGVFYFNSYVVNLYSPTSSARAGTFGIDVSSSNSIYTNSGHVYPLSLALNFIIKT